MYKYKLYIIQNIQLDLITNYIIKIGIMFKIYVLSLSTMLFIVMLKVNGRYHKHTLKKMFNVHWICS